MTVLKGIDISNHQKGFSLSATKPDFVIVKATGTRSPMDETKNSDGVDGLDADGRGEDDDE